MTAVFGIFMLFAFIRIIDMVHKPFLCAFIYTVLLIIPAFVTGKSLIVIGVGGAIIFGYMSLYFWLVERFGGWLHWVILITGALPLLALFMLASI